MTRPSFCGAGLLLDKDLDRVRILTALYHIFSHTTNLYNLCAKYNNMLGGGRRTREQTAGGLVSEGGV